PGALVQVFVDGSAQDLAGNALSAYQGQFTVAPDPTTTAPTVTRVSPPSTSGLPRNSVFVMEFSEALDPATVSASTVRLVNQSTGAIVAGTVALEDGGRRLRFVPTAPLEAASTFYIELTSGLRDLQGTAFGGQDFFNLATAA